MAITHTPVVIPDNWPSLSMILGVTLSGFGAQVSALVYEHFLFVLTGMLLAADDSDNGPSARDGGAGVDGNVHSGTSYSTTSTSNPGQAVG